MGQSTDAYLFYGYWFSGEHEQDELLEQLMDELYKDEGPVGIDSHCSCEYPMYYVYVKITHKRAWRGNPVEINPEHVQVESSWQDALDSFVTQHDLTPPGTGGEKSYDDKTSEYGWWLVSNLC